MVSQIGTHTFVFNPSENGGEHLSLVTKFFDNGDGEVFVYQELSLQSYGNHASLGFSAPGMMPEQLRTLANELESALLAKKVKLRVARFSQGVED